MGTSSSSALAQNGSNRRAASSSLPTLAPTEPPRNPRAVTPSSSCPAARSGCCRETVARAANRSGLAAQIAARPSFCARINPGAISRSTAYQNGLMLRTSTSIPMASMACRRSGPMVRARLADVAPPIISRTPGISQCACTSTVVIRRPPTTTCRRAAAPAGCPAAAAASRTPAPARAMPAIALAVCPMKCLRVAILLLPGRRAAAACGAPNRCCSFSRPIMPPFERRRAVPFQGDRRLDLQRGRFSMFRGRYCGRSPTRRRISSSFSR